MNSLCSVINYVSSSRRSYQSFYPTSTIDRTLAADVEFVGRPIKPTSSRVIPWLYQLHGAGGFCLPFSEWNLYFRRKMVEGQFEPQYSWSVTSGSNPCSCMGRKGTPALLTVPVGNTAFVIYSWGKDEKGCLFLLRRSRTLKLELREEDSPNLAASIYILPSVMQCGTGGER